MKEKVQFICGPEDQRGELYPCAAYGLKLEHVSGDAEMTTERTNGI